ncbi:phage head closure protein [Salinicola rhizosphaerae]|uniref:Head-tail adaptor protein n=1 Tax=Salinicola rhizosphaerae TaxID=1443141 RepID=A0ABQ3E971_9GAMM|nr:phage head closure protein [Salinicola rhizosphaerae]GHB30484.1 head-tail adaptor protein [Salinicola rhizosphaerae]
MQAGKLRHRVRLESKQLTQNPQTGAMVESWQPVATVWASIEPLSAREFIAAGAEQSSVTTRIVIRYREGVTAQMRAVSRGKTYNIEGVLPDPRSGREYLTLPCSEGVNDG